MTTTDFTASTTRKYATAAMSTLTLSRVMIPCDWIGIVTMRSDTFLNRSMTGMMNLRPGSLTPMTRPSRNHTPFSYWVTTRIDNATTISATMTTAMTTATTFISLLLDDEIHGQPCEVLSAPPSQDRYRSQPTRRGNTRAISAACFHHALAVSPPQVPKDLAMPGGPQAPLRNGSTPVSRIEYVGHQPKHVGGVPTVGHLGANRL